MVMVTSAAKNKFKEILQQRNPEGCIRIVFSRTKKDSVDLVFGKAKEGDQVLESDEGKNILTVENDVAAVLKGKVIDYKETEKGSGFSIS